MIAVVQLLPRSQSSSIAACASDRVGDNDDCRETERDRLPDVRSRLRRVFAFCRRVRDHNIIITRNR